MPDNITKYDDKFAYTKDGHKILLRNLDAKYTYFKNGIWRVLESAFNGR